MDAIELAALPESTPLIAALVTMRARNESGLICVGSHHDLTLVTPRDVMVALHHDLDVLGQIRTGRSVTDDLVQFEPAEIGGSKNWFITAQGRIVQGHSGGVIRFRKDMLKRLESHFAQGNDFTVAELDLGRAIIITSSEKYAHFLRRSVPNFVCSCSDEFHDFDVQPPICQMHGCPVFPTV